MDQIYITTLQSRLNENSDSKTKSWWENYVKESAPFRGVKMPVIRSILHEWYREFITGSPADHQIELALALLRAEYTEDKLAGILFLQEIVVPAGAIECQRDIGRLAALFSEGHIYDWNICDWFCVKVLGPLIQREGEACAARIAEWRTAANLWQARASLVPFVKVAGDSAYYSMIRECCYTVIRREERFAKTAVGWLLRDISKHDRHFVRQVIEENLNYFSPESLKNALKYFDEKDRNMYKNLANQP